MLFFVRYCDFEIYFIRGESEGHYDTLNLEASLEDFNKGLELKPNFAKGYFGRGCVKNHLKYYEDAILDFDKAIELYSNYAFAYGNRGYAKFKKNNIIGAIADYLKAIYLR